LLFCLHSLSVRIGALIFETLWLRLSGLAFGIGLGGGVDPFQFHGGLAIGTRCRSIENSGDGGASSLRLAGGAGCFAWLHNRFVVFGARRLFATVWSLLWNYQPAFRIAVHCLFPNSIVTTTAMGLTLPVLIGRSNVAANQFLPRDWFSVWLNTLGAVVGGCFSVKVISSGRLVFEESLAAGLASCSLQRSLC